MLKCIHVVPGETDLRQFPKHILVAMLAALSQTFNIIVEQKAALNGEIEELQAEFDELCKIAGPMGKEIERIRAHIDELERPTLEDLMNEHIRTFGRVYDESGRHLTDVREKHIRIEMPVANDDWSFAAYDWARAFIKKHPEAFIDGNKMLNRGFLYINCYQIPKVRW